MAGGINAESQPGRIEWGDLSREEAAELYAFAQEWSNLPPALQAYYNLKGLYFKRITRMRSIWMVLLILAFTGMLVWLVRANLALSLAVMAGGIIIGIILAWELQRRPPK